MKVCVILVAGSEKQNKCFWPTYNKTIPGVAHDLIVVHRNNQFLIETNLVLTFENCIENIILENKIDKNGKELEHKAFGAYRYYFNLYKDKYDCFAFISDDVLIKQRVNWLLDAVMMLFSYDKLGFVGSQIFNSLLNQYPHESHCRAPIWFGKTSALKDINWEFESDHDGEMKLANQFLAAGYFGAQIGNKINFAYDSIENGGLFVGDHVSSLLAKHFGLDIYDFVQEDKTKEINDILLNNLYNGNDAEIIKSPYSHIGERKIISQLQPFNGLVFDKSIELCSNYINKFPFDIYLL